MSDEVTRLAEIEARAKAATAEPWAQWAEHGIVLAGPLAENTPPVVRGGRGRICEVDLEAAEARMVEATTDDDEIDYDVSAAQACADAAFIAAAREDIPWLIAHIRAMEAERSLTRKLTANVLDKARCAVGMQAGVWGPGDCAMQQLHRALLALGAKP